MLRTIRSLLRLDRSSVPSFVVIVTSAVLYVSAPVYLFLLAVVAPNGLDPFRPSLETMAQFLLSSESDLILHTTLFMLLSMAFLLILSLLFLSEARRNRGPFYLVDGVLKKENEISISFRVRTLQRMLGPLVPKVGQEQFNSVMFEGGTVAGSAFGDEFKNIYRERVVLEGDWALLRDRERLHHWADWDNRSGWGRVLAIIEGNTIRVSYDHPKLFVGDVGEGFIYFLAGYCEAALSGLLRHRPRVKFRGPSSGIKREGDAAIDLYFDVTH